MLLSHVFLGITDFERALAFYTPLMASLDAKLRFVERERPWAGWQAADAVRPLLLIGGPFDGQPASVGNGQMVALMATGRAMVERAHAVALAHGGTCDGPPGPRPEYHPHYYGAYFRDPDGNKLCVCCHEPA